jgi:hypothetical protein
MLKKIFYFIVVFLILSVSLLLAVPLVFKGRIINEIKKLVNENLTATVDFKDVDLSLIEDFPNLTLSLKDLNVVGTDTFRNDTLADIKKLSLEVDIKSVVFEEEIKILNVSLNEPKLNIITLANGKANWDIMKPDTSTSAELDTAPSKFKANLKFYEIKNGTLVYDDRSLTFYTKLENFYHSGKGDFTQDVFELQTTTKVKSFTMAYGGIDYLHNVYAELDVPIKIDLKKSIYTFLDNKAMLNAVPLRFEGAIEMPADDIIMDLKFAALESNFKSILSLVPVIYSHDYDKLAADGTFALNGYAKGVYNDTQMPAFGINLQINKGYFKYPELPIALEKAGLDLKVNCADGNLDNTEININRCHFEIQNDAVDMTLQARNVMKDPYAIFSFAGNLNLGKISQIVPLDGMELAGRLNSSFTFKGSVSDVERNAFDKIQAGGTLSVRGFKYSAKDLALPISIPVLDIAANTKKAYLNNCSINIGKSDMALSGSLSNYLAFVLSNEELAGDLTLNSNLLDVNELMSLAGEDTSSTASADTASMALVELPKNIQFAMNASIKTLKYDDMDITNAYGQVELSNGRLNFNRLAFNALDGSMSMTGYYFANNSKEGKVNLSIDAKSIDIQKTFKTFNTVQKLAPIAEQSSGKISASFSLTTDLDGQMNPVMNSINSNGNIFTQNVVLTGSTVMNKTADLLKNSELKRLIIDNAKLLFEVNDGRVNVKPFDVKFGKIGLNIGGFTTFDQLIDYTFKISIPQSLLGAGAAGTIQGFTQNLSGKESANTTLDLTALVGGTFLKPEVKISLQSFKDNLKDAIN